MKPQILPPIDPANLHDALTNIANAARQEFAADFGFVLAINPITLWIIEPEAEHKPNLNELSYQKLEELVTPTLETDWLSHDLTAIQLNNQPRVISEQSLSTLISITIRTTRLQKPLAVLFLGFQELRQFSQEELELLPQFTEQAALVLKTTWLLRRYREVILLGQKISQDLQTPEKLFLELNDSVKDILDTSHFFALAVYQPQSDSLDLYMSDREKYRKEMGSSLSGGCADVIKQKKSLRIFSYSEKRSDRPLAFEFEQIPDTDERIPESLIYVPLLLRGVAVGALTVQHLPKDFYRRLDQQILEMIATQVALAIGNMRLFEYLKEVNIAGQQLTRQLSPAQIRYDVVNRIRANAKADFVVLYSYNQSEEKFIVPPDQSGELIGRVIPKPEVKPDDIAWLALKKGKELFVKSAIELYLTLGGDPEKERKGDFERREQVASVAVLPLRVGDDIMGILFVNFRKPQRFDAAQKSLILSLTNFAAIAIRNSSLLDTAIHRRLEDIERLRQIDIEISQSLDLSEVLHKILEGSNAILKADNAAILLIDSRKQNLKVEAAIGNDAAQTLGSLVPISRQTGMTLWAYQEKKTARSGDVHNDPDMRNHYYDLIDSTVSEIDVPLRDGNEVIGVLNYESRRKNAFSLEDELFIEALALKAVNAVKNAQNFEREKRVVEELTAMQEIVGDLNYDDVLDTILANALEITGSQAGVILLLDGQRDELYVAREQGLEKDDLRIPKGQGITWEAMENEQSVLVNATDPLWKKKFLDGIPNAYWELAVPIFSEDQAIGVIDIESGEDHPLTKRDEELLERLATLAAIALQNAEQFSDLVDRETRLEALRSIDQKIIEEEGDPQQVIEEVLEQVQFLTDAEIAGLHLYQEGVPRVAYLNKMGEKAKLEIWGDDSREYANGIVAHVAQSGKAYRTGNAQEEEKELYKGPSSINSELAIPLRSKEQIIGVLNIESPRRDAFDQHHEEILSELAGQASIAIQSALSFREAKEQSLRFQRLTEVGEQLSRITEPEQIESAYDIVLKKMEDYSEVEILIRRFDEGEQEFVLVRLAHQQQSKLPQRIKVDHGINGMARHNRETIYIEDRANYLANHPEIFDPIIDPAIQTIIASPIQVENRYFGNLILSHQSPGYFKKADIRLAEGLAKQLAITLQRIETLETQRKAEQQASETELFGELGQSAYEVTHRLGNDLGLVRTYANNILSALREEGVSNPVIEEELEKVVKDVSRALGLSRAMKERMSDIGKSRQASQTLLAIALVENLKRSLPVLSKNIELNWEVSDITGHLQVNTTQIADIVVNLVANAADAMAEGGQILIRGHQKDSKFHLEVSDNGPGISPKNQQKIFNLFFSTKESSGFGLWSARRYARKNSGDLILKESVIGKGSTFALWLPLF